ncbi:MAG: cytochrome c-type biogenesis protein CcmH [Alphaproteobacteria bacterium]|nr:cytochrome c-type biogenesis protein CcmH [Alphaproteobacteria bacterium]
MKALVAFFLVLCLSLPVQAVEPDEMLADPQLEARARAISKNLRCAVCDGQDIDDSNADLAADMRRTVREKITAGASDDEIYDWLRQRYGDKVLMTPPVTPVTMGLWLLPVLIFAGGVAMVIFQIRRSA